jgi:NAD(P)-dependent dehydrogenase (short-subunit alcohol dehydrogenase family)
MKTAIVTGASSGIGAAISAAAVAAGYRVGILDAVADRAQAYAAKLGNAVALPCDVTDEAAVIAAFDTFGETPDLVVNNAGIVKFGMLTDVSLEDFRKVLDVDLIGSFLVARTAGKRMAQRGSGSIVNITSINSQTPSLGTNAYAAAKAGMSCLTQLMALELGPQGVRVNAVSPGLIDAGMGAAVYVDNPAARTTRSKGVPLRRLGSADDVANAVMFLASDAASYVNGHEIVVDGGLIHSVMSQLPRS